ncbi:DNA-binding transcriptional regulator, Lrp family [Rhizobiales bacterium GAS191]|jgi:Lrp/AsnC family leucine-responsive transcriptional regulator|nr:DNA-binding transcriptional regulator, Lrp family [Rhizobiales bacterium GAS113]SEC04810.1 DNA-binding transcriptional regulator, Lrp family [Rhizobiales bacterium GAS188]SED17654.1 DNA-binding transcriptional regulator, Lrp family [Rhizobiales bacterium GAS191]
MQPITLDAKDRAILRLLQLEGRLSNAELAERVHLSASACLRRVRALEESGLIASYATLLDQKRAGFDGNAFVQVTLDGQGRASLDAFEAAVKQVSQILECWLLAGQADYLLRVVFRDTTDLERMHAEIITQLPHVVRVQSTLTLRTVKKTTALPV